MPALSRHYDPAIGPLISIVIAEAGKLRGLVSAGKPETKPLVAHDFLLDTGADRTCISPKIVSDLGLRPVSQINMATPSGISPANVYLVDVGIVWGPNIVEVSERVSVIEFNGSSTHYKGLIGRDFICRGVFSISFDGHFTFAI